MKGKGFQNSTLPKLTPPPLTTLNKPIMYRKLKVDSLKGMTKIQSNHTLRDNINKQARSDKKILPLMETNRISNINSLMNIEFLLDS